MSENPQLTPEQLATQKKSRLTFLAIIGVFFLPYFIVPAVFDLDEMGKTNKGTLIVPHIAIETLQLSLADGQPYSNDQETQKWAMLYLLPETCGQACRNAMYAIRQVNKGLDRDSSRVRRILVTTNTPDTATQALIANEFPGMLLTHSSVEVVDQAFQSIGSDVSQAGYIYLSSPDGQIFLYHLSYEDEKVSILKAREIRKDLKKSLKGSLIG